MSKILRTKEEHDELRREIVGDSQPRLQRVRFIPLQTKDDWLDPSNPAEKRFIDTFGIDANRSRLDEAESNYYISNFNLMFLINKAANELHQACLLATERILQDDALLSRFGIPEIFWPKLRSSWETQRATISGRFDFAFNGKELKAYEYNADSASTLMEYAVVQGKYLNMVGLGDHGWSAGGRIGMELRTAWTKAKVKGLVHFLIDDDVEEEYTALLVMEMAEKAGLQTKLIKSLSDFTFLEGGKSLVDAEGQPVTTVWKTWSWETAIEDYRLAEEARGKDFVPAAGSHPRLCDVLFLDDIKVFEPFWKAIPSNKAILPILWEMNPGHPNLLKAEWVLTEELKASGYVQKPIVGRCGQNISIVGTDGGSIAASLGQFETRDLIYQEIFELPDFDGYHACIGGWIVNGIFSGFGIREDKSVITNIDSPCSAVQIAVSDDPDSDEERKPTWLPFGTIQGYTPEGFPCFSSDYKTGNRDDDYNSFTKVGDREVYCGAKWQCVEFARRYLILKYGVTFASVPMAYNIFELATFHKINEEEDAVNIIKHENKKSKIYPQVGNLLIWGAGGRHTGHVAVVTAVGSSSIFIGEQNWDFDKWVDGTDFSRELEVRTEADGAFYIHDQEEDHIIGWVEVVLRD